MKNIIIISLILLISACTSSGGKSVDKLYYRFPQVTIVPVDKNFSIIKPIAMGVLGNRPMVAQDVNGGLLQMNHNFWLDSPKVLLYNYLNKIFTNIEEGENKLSSEIMNLEKVAGNSVLAIKFSLLDKNNKVLFTKTYTIEKSLDQNDIPTFVKSISSSLEDIIQQLINDI